MRNFFLLELVGVFLQSKESRSPGATMEARDAGIFMLEPLLRGGIGALGSTCGNGVLFEGFTLNMDTGGKGRPVLETVFVMIGLSSYSGGGCGTT